MMSRLPSDVVVALAEIFHEKYMETVIASNSLNPEKPSHVAWADLGQEYRDSNVRQVNQVCRAVAQAGYRFARVDDDDTRAVASLSFDDIERIAQREHNEWLQDMYDRGFTRGDTHVDTPSMKTHPDMAHWDDLDEATRAKDIDPYLDFLPRLRRVGYVLIAPEGR